MFAQLIAQGVYQSAAYIQAGYEPEGSRANSSRLITNDSISARIEELKIENLEKAKKDLAMHLVEINDIITRAKSIGQYSAAVKAFALKMRLLGHI